MRLDVSHILERLPDALENPAIWDDVFDLIKTEASAPHMVVAGRDGNGQLQLDDTPWEHPFVCGYDGENGIRPYLDHYRTCDRWDHFKRGIHDHGAVLVSEMQGHRLEDNAEFWEWLAPLDITDNAYVKLFDLDDGWVGLNVHFDRKSGDGAYILRLLDQLKKPLGTCIKLQQKGLTANRNTEDECLQSRIPRFLLRANGATHMVNAAAEVLLNDHSGLFWVNGAIKFRDSSLQQSFAKAIDRAIRFGLPQIVAARPERVGQYVTLVISPVRTSRDPIHTIETLLQVSVLDDSHHAPLIHPFAQAHGFTPRQTTVLVELDKGKGIRQTAQALGLSYEYVRSIIYKEIFPVLGVTELTELVALLGRIHRVAV